MDKAEQVLELKKAMEKALTQGASGYDVINDALSNLADVPISLDMLKKTKIGVFVNQLRKSDLPSDMSAKAKNLVKKWKNEMGEPEGTTPVSAKKESSSSNLQKSGSNGNIKTEKEKLKGMSRLFLKKLTRKVETTSTSIKDSPMTGTPDEGPRKPSQDGLEWPSTKNTKRDKCGEMIYAGLSTASWSDPQRRLKLAVEIEERTYKEYYPGGEPKYLARIRSLYSNLKDKANPGLREQVLQGDIAIVKFCSMTTAEMASDDLKKEWEKMQKQNMDNATVPQANTVETDEFKCGKCGQRRCSYYQKQTRSADEPMTTFVTCLNCNNRWKFC